MEYRLSDTFSFKNILSYRKSALTSTFQLDGNGGLVNIPVAALPGGRVLTLANATNSANSSLSGGGVLGAVLGNGIPAGVPFVFLANNTYNREHQWSDEFQINVETDWFRVTAGFLHFSDTIRTGGAPDVYNTLITSALYGQGTSSPRTPFVVPGNYGFEPNNITAKSDAVFIQPEIHLTDRLDFVAGARITKDRKRGFEVAPDQWVASGNAAPPRPTVSAPVSYRDSEATFLAGLNFRPTDNILTYIKYADGYISGGQLATIPFEPERAYSYEAGIKADLFDRRFRSNLAVFYVNYKAIQITTTGLSTGVASSLLYGQAVVSAADARAQGFEWENTIVPVRGVTLTANLGYTDFKWDQDTVYGGPGANGETCRGKTCTGGFVLQAGAPGLQPFFRPKWTSNLSAQYDSEEVLMSGHFSLRLDANFRSKTLLTNDITADNMLNEAAIPS
ncbi:MAG: hypothetical protein EOP69_01365 [Spirochaetia bacterium]|nr:MAG: hypothetical protein EOP69_01365 [Spirochaetia bacterium]